MRSKTIITIAATAFVGVAVLLIWQFSTRKRVPMADTPATPSTPTTISTPKADSNVVEGAKAESALDLAGFWEGNLQVQTATLRLVLKISRTAEGGYAATLDSVDQGVKDIPVNTITLTNQTLRVALIALSANYEGILNARGTEMSGEWQQGPVRVPLTLIRTTSPSKVAEALPASAYARRQDAPLQGWWAGTMKVRDTSLRLIFKIAASPPGTYTATLDSPDQGAKGMPVSLVEFKPPDVRFDVDSIGGQFEGILAADGTSIDGSWNQGGANLTLQLRRSDPAEATALPASAYAFARETEPQGIWNGALDIRGTKLRLVLKIAKVSEGNYRATLDSPDQGSKDIPATSVTFKDADLEVEWKALRALFHGQLEKGKLTGFWQQGPAEFPLDMERTNSAAAPRANP